MDLEVELSIDQFNLLAEKFVDKSIAAVRQAFEYAQTKRGENIIHDIVLVGGTSHLQMIEPKLKKAFPSVQVVTSTDREFAVAKGAAIWAANLDMFAEVINCKKSLCKYLTHIISFR
jgi:molecular chaperone DnaK (HSP70)